MLKSAAVGLNLDRLKDYRGEVLKSEVTGLNWDRLKDFRGVMLKT